MKTFISVLMLFSLFAGCATVREPSISQQEKEKILQIAEANPLPHAMRMSGRVAIKGDKGWVRSKAAVIMRRPHDMRITLMNAYGTAWFVATSDEKTVSYALPAKGIKETEEGNGSALFLRLGPLKISPADLIRFVYPGVDGELLREGGVRLYNRRILAREGTLSVTYHIGEDGRVAATEVRRGNGSPLRFAYEWKPNGFTVSLNGMVRFEIEKIAYGGDMEDDLFAPLQ